jgi:uncharacterized protein YecE (DUF72 family)
MPEREPPPIYAGTSGFAYKEWRGLFYPQGLAAGQMLPYYAGRLPAVEINATFYRMPRLRTILSWGEQVPPSFRFTFKAPAVITHRKKLVQADSETAFFLDTVKGLGEKLGAVLFQLPPFLPCDRVLLENFIASLPDVRAAFEFRHPSWFDDEIFALLAEKGFALCISDRENVPEPPRVATASFGYLRLRRNEYDSKQLNMWRDFIATRGWQEAYVFFRHEASAHGTVWAEHFK